MLSSFFLASVWKHPIVMELEKVHHCAEAVVHGCYYAEDQRIKEGFTDGQVC